MEIIFNSAHGQFNLQVPSNNLSIIDICKLNDLPFQSICFYYVNKENKLSLVRDIYTNSIDKLKREGINQIILQPNRNINFSKILQKDISVKPADSKFSTEYTFQAIEFEKLVNNEFVPSECFSYIQQSVDEFLAPLPLDNRKIIVGISGGGDSNTLLRALVKNKQIKNEQIIAVMCTGLNVWDSAIERARYICKEVDIELNLVDSREICDIIGKKRSEKWDEAFFEVFEDSDIDALGTLIVRKVLQHYVKKHHAQCMITGLNLEDLLAESFFQVTKKKLPLPFPIREIDEVPLWFPLYQVPKKILDGCYPKFSLENYQQRNPDKLINRAIPYYFSQMTSSVLPGYEFDLLNGFQKLSELNTNPFHFEEDLGFSVNEPLSKVLKDKWKYFTVC